MSSPPRYALAARPFFIIVALCLIHISAIAAPIFIERAEPPKPVEGGILFTVEAPDAAKVYVAGDFNNWGNNQAGKVTDPDAVMQRSAPNGIWFRVATLPEATAKYKYVIIDKDGKTRWMADPLVTVADGEGNSIYDPSTSTVQKELFANSSVRVSLNEAANEMSITFLGEKGKARETAPLAPIIMDGVVQPAVTADPAKPGHLSNGAIWLEVANAGDHSVSLTYGANDGNIHYWTFRVQGDDSYYGGGERFNSVNQKTYILPMSSRDNPNQKGAGTYKPVPFIMFSRGFGMWIDSWTPGIFDLNATERWVSNFHYKEDKLRIVFIDGPKYSDILKEYTALTGRPPVPPAWSFAPWKSRNVHRNREDILEDVEKYRKYDLPASVLVIDSPWERGYNDFVLNDEQFTDPKAMFARVQELGFYTCLWLTPFVNSKNSTDMKGITKGASSNYQEAVDGGFLVKNSKGEVMTTKWWKGYGGLVDFTNPKAVEWWMGQLDKTKEWGVKVWKCDDGEGDFVSDAVFADGSRADQMKGRFAYVYLEAMQKYIDERMGGDGTLFVRPGFAGTQKFPYGWSGDNNASFSFENGFPGVIRAAQTSALSGLSLWSCDIAGYHGTQTPELFDRWTEFAAFVPLMQLHMTTNLGPWDFGDESLNIYRKYAKLHTQLFPYIYAAAKESHETGMPIIRPMVLAFQGDDMASQQEFQYMFGPDFLVAPMYQAGTHRTVYLPKGTTWINYWTGEVMPSDKLVEVEAPLDTIPLYVRAGAVIPMIPSDVDTLVPRTDKMAKDIVTLDDRRIMQVWPGANAKVTAEGITVETTAGENGAISVKVSGTVTRPLELHLMHQKLTAKDANPAADSVKYEYAAKATVLSWKSFSGAAEIGLNP
ncbi:hypothetical protein BH09SUM1_BH09SUM1_00390 [soil metagenome]